MYFIIEIEEVILSLKSFEFKRDKISIKEKLGRFLRKYSFMVKEIKFIGDMNVLGLL